MKKKKYLLILSLVLSSIICLGAVSVIFAWVVNADIMRKMEFQILQIDSAINFYRAKDENYNGVPDLLKTNGHELKTYEDKDEETTENKTENAYKAYQSPYYDEKYDFKLIDNKFMLSSDTSANTFTDISIENAAPSRVYTFKAEIINYSGLPVTLKCVYDQPDTTTHLDKLETRIGSVNPDGTVTILSDWKAFVTAAETPMCENIKIEGATGENQLDLWLQIRMKPGATAPENTKISLPYFRSTLEIRTGSDVTKTT